MKREIDFHEVTVRFVVRKDRVAQCAEGFPGAPEVTARSSEKTRREALAWIVEQGIGGNEMNSLECEMISVTVDEETK